MLHVCTYMYMYIIQIKYKNLLMYKNKYMMINCKIRIIRHTQFKPGERGGGYFNENVTSLTFKVYMYLYVCALWCAVPSMQQWTISISQEVSMMY